MLEELRAEISANFDRFDQNWPTDFDKARLGLQQQKQKFLESYSRIASIQAWRTSLISGSMSEQAEAFFFEFQNDLLISHCLARSGSFRQSLKGLRSAIENFYFCLFYKDHPVELEKWDLGRHRISFSELTNYFETHPLISDCSIPASGIDQLKNEYSTLSKAVHGSARQFRMTRDLNQINLWDGNAISASQWASREKAVIGAANLILLGLYRSSLQGTKQVGLRSVVSLMFPNQKKTAIKSELGVSLTSI